jgi:FMN phosphatase YigB (HAD superfamily)
MTTDIPSCIALDFDNTLSYFAGGYEELYRIFTDLGFSLDVVKKAYREVVPNGFSLVRLIRTLEENTGHLADVGYCDQKFNEWLSGNLRLYPDVIPFMEAHKEIPFVIVTAGDEMYQKRKIEMSGLFPASMYFVERKGEKTGPIRELLAKFGPKIYFVDDHPIELDSLRDGGLIERDIVTFRILRKESAYANLESRYSHKNIKTLNEIFK